jgi:hypothetical protein
MHYNKPAVLRNRISKAAQYIVAVIEDHQGGTVSRESDVTSIALGRKGTAKHR